ncbi:MAG: flagellar biosynthetic protein FliO [Planctomycetaceae bacterium]|nr:flagellar biosynthetic protein FliO [Planctomycetaceae bacterium]
MPKRSIFLYSVLFFLVAFLVQNSFAQNQAYFTGNNEQGKQLQFPSQPPALSNERSNPEQFTPQVQWPQPNSTPVAQANVAPADQASHERDTMNRLRQTFGSKPETSQKNRLVPNEEYQYRPGSNVRSMEELQAKNQSAIYQQTQYNSPQNPASAVTSAANTIPNPNAFTPIVPVSGTESNQADDTSQNDPMTAGQTESSGLDLISPFMAPASPKLESNFDGVPDTSRQNSALSLSPGSLSPGKSVKENETTGQAFQSPVMVPGQEKTDHPADVSKVVTETSGTKYSDKPLPELPPPSEKKSWGIGKEHGRLSDSLPPLATVASGLAIVLGVFFLMVWLMKRGNPRKAGALPKEVFEKLGSIPFSPKMQMHLFRLGGKLVLVSVTPDGMEPVAEVTDPDEVIHLVGLCKQNDPKSSSAMFRQVLKQYTGEKGNAPQQQMMGQYPQQYQQQQYPPHNMQQTVRRTTGSMAGSVGLSPVKAYQR